MKKFLVMFAIAGALVACNNDGTGGSNAEDSIRRADSIRREDSLRNLQTMPMPGGDTTGTGTGDTTGTGGGTTGDTTGR